jgi:hypothetical protein
MQIFFSLIFVRIHTKIVIQIVYYEFVHGVVFVPIHTFFYTNCIVRIHTTSRERAARREGKAQAARAKPEHTSCPDQAAPGCPDVRVHPAAPTS